MRQMQARFVLILKLTVPALLLIFPALGAPAFNFGRHKDKSAAGAPAARPAPATSAPAQPSPAEQDQETGPVEGRGQNLRPPAGREPAAPPGHRSSAAGQAVPGAAAAVTPLRFQDVSAQYFYILPKGRGRYQIPFQPHDCLTLREEGKTLATISFDDKPGKSSLEHLKKETSDYNKEQLEKYQLQEEKIISLENGLQCAQIIGQATFDEKETRLVQCIFPLKKKHYLQATLTVAKPIGEKYDKLLHEVVASITTNSNPDKLVK